MSAIAITYHDGKVHLFSDGLAQWKEGNESGIVKDHCKIHQLSDDIHLLAIGYWRGANISEIKQKINSSDIEKISYIVAETVKQHKHESRVTMFTVNSSGIVYWIDSQNDFEPKKINPDQPIYFISQADNQDTVQGFEILARGCYTDDFFKACKNAFQIWINLLKAAGTRCGGQIFTKTLQS